MDFFIFFFKKVYVSKYLNGFSFSGAWISVLVFNEGERVGKFSVNIKFKMYSLKIVLQISIVWLIATGGLSTH